MMTLDPRRLRRRPPLWLLAVLASCSALPVMLDAASNLLSTAARNYSPTYADSVNSLLTSLLADPGEERLSASAGTASGAGLGLDVALLAQRQGSDPGVEAVDDGATLVTGDRIKVTFRAETACFVYVVGIDGSGWATPMFPIAQSAAGNPVRAGRDQMIPDDPFWFELDDVPGVEHVFFLASHEARPDLEALLADLAGRERPATDAGYRVEERAIIQRGLRVTKDAAPVTVTTPAGLTEEVDLASYFSQAGDLVITRWFTHEERPGE